MPSYKATVKIFGAVDKNLFGRNFASLKTKAIERLTYYEPGFGGTQPDRIILAIHAHRISGNKSAWKELEVIRYADIPKLQQHWRTRKARPAKYVRRSICDCGFSVLKDEIPLGTEYKVVVQDKAQFTFTCGGCQKQLPIIGVWVNPYGYLPIGIFEINENENAQPEQAEQKQESQTQA